MTPISLSSVDTDLATRPGRSSIMAFAYLPPRHQVGAIDAWAALLPVLLVFLLDLGLGATVLHIRGLQFFAAVVVANHHLHDSRCGGVVRAEEIGEASE